MSGRATPILLAACIIFAAVLWKPQPAQAQIITVADGAICATVLPPTTWKYQRGVSCRYSATQAADLWALTPQQMCHAMHDLMSGSWPGSTEACQIRKGASFGWELCLYKLNGSCNGSYVVNRQNGGDPCFNDAWTTVNPSLWYDNIPGCTPCPPPKVWNSATNACVV